MTAAESRVEWETYKETIDSDGEEKINAKSYVFEDVKVEPEMVLAQA